MTDLEASLAAWVLPLGDTGAGVDARYDPAYERIRAEVAKLDALSASPVAWDVVRDAADELLRTRSKDLFVGACLSRALAVDDGLSGGTLGLRLLARLIGEYQDRLHPLRARGRASALAWLVDHLTKALLATSMRASQRDALDAFRSALASLTEGARALLGEACPSFSPLWDAVERLSLSMPVPSDTRAVVAPSGDGEPVATVSLVPPSAPTNRAETVSQAGASASIQSTPVAAASHLGDVPDFLGKTSMALTEVARICWRGDRRSPVPYRLLRTALWLHLDHPPEHDVMGRTTIPPPEERLVERLNTMMVHGAFEQLLESSEATLSTARFWLDLHWFVDRALAGLGAPFAEAQAAAREGARALIARMPSLTKLSFSDGTPLAGPETVAWLTQRTQSSGGAEAVTGTTKDAPVDASAIHGALAGDGPRDVLEHLREACSDARARFVFDLTVAAALVERNQLTAARALYEALDGDAIRHGLDVWEPALSLRLMVAHVRCLERLATSEPGTREMLSALRVRVARLSPAALVSLGS